MDKAVTISWDVKRKPRRKIAMNKVFFEAVVSKDREIDSTTIKIALRIADRSVIKWVTYKE